MKPEERKALVLFMRRVMLELHPHCNEYPLKEIGEKYAEFGKISRDFLDVPEYQKTVFYMDRAIQVINQERKELR